MPLMPKRTKHRKVQKGRNRGKATRGNTVSYGEFGLQAIDAGLITGNQIEAARVAMTRYMKEMVKFGYIKEKFFQQRKWKEEKHNAINAKKNKA